MMNRRLLRISLMILALLAAFPASYADVQKPSDHTTPLLAFQTEKATDTQRQLPENTFAFTHELFGLKINQTLADIQTYQPGPSPFKQKNSYLLIKPPVSDSTFPIVIATFSEKETLCRVSGSFAIQKESPQAVHSLLQLVMHFSNTLGSPTSTDTGHILWQQIATNPLTIRNVSIFTDQLPEDITLITISYDLANQADCPEYTLPESDEVTLKNTENTENTEKN